MTLNNVHVKNRTQLLPKESSSDHLGALLKGFLSTRTVMAAEEAAEVPMMLHAESQELVDSANNVTAVDDSLSPRAVAVTILAYGGSEDNTRGARTHLDALAHLASTPLELHGVDGTLTAGIVRFSVLAGVDAEWFARQTQSGCLDTSPTIEMGVVDVCVRWVNPGMTSVRAEFKKMSSGLSLDGALEEMQNCFLSMKVAYQVPFPDAIAVNHPNVPNDAWAKTMHTASVAFFALMEGTPCVFKGDVLKKHEGEVTVESTDIFVRICPRRQHHAGQWHAIPVEEARKRADGFHAFLVGNASFLSEIKSWVSVFQQTGLPPPDEDTHAYCLHTCAVQANGFPLQKRVSLYATHPRNGGRRPGVSICHPGSWVWRMEPAIVALEHVLENFYVIPCNRDSVMPGDRKLEKPFNEFFNRAYKLYTDTFGFMRSESSEDFERLPLSLPTESSGGDPMVRAAEDYALTAFNLDASSHRIVVGDAFLALSARQAPNELTQFMLQAALRTGINTSVLSALGTAAEAVRTMQHSGARAFSAHAAEVARLKRVADAALEVGAKRHKPLSPPVEVDPAKVKMLMTAVGLRKGTEAKFPDASTATLGDYSDVVQVVAHCVVKGPPEQRTSEHAVEAAYRGRKGVMGCLSGIICVLRSSERAIPATVFLVHQSTTKDSVSFNRVTPNGGFEATTMGAIVDAPTKAVLLIKSTPLYTRVTSTVHT